MASQAQDAISSFGDRAKNPEHYYELLLVSCERLFDNEIEQHAFEDQTRYMFGTKVISNVIPSMLKSLNVLSVRLQMLHRG